MLVAAILRDGATLLSRYVEELRPGDQLLCLLPPGQEKALISLLLPERRAEDVQTETSIDSFDE